MKKLLSLVTIFIAVGIADAAIRRYLPQGPSGHSSCTGVNANLDLDGDGLPGSTDTGCTGGAYDQFSAVTGGYAAHAEDGFLTNTLEVSADANSPTTFGVSVKSSARIGYGDLRLCGNFTNGDYYLKVFGNVPASPTLTYISTSPLANHPATATRSVLNVPDTSNWSTEALKAGYNRPTGSFDNEDYKLTLSGNACIDFRIFRGSQLTSVFLSTNATQAPSHPASGPTPDYTLYKKGAGNTITIDGVGNEGVWAHASGAPAVSWLGTNTSNDTSATVQFVRDGVTIYFLAKANDSSISCNSTGNDQNATWESCDHWEFLFHNGQDTTRDAETVKFDIDTNNNVYDANWDGGSETSVFDFANVSTACVVGSGVKTCEGKFDLNWTPSDDATYLGNVLHADYDSSAFTYLGFGVAGSFNALANARYVKFSSTALGTLTTPDVTAPTFASTSDGTPSSSGTQLTATINESASCTFKYGTSSNSYANYPNTLGTTSAQLSGSDYIASLPITGLNASTQYYWRAQCTDTASNAATSTEDSFTTAAVVTASCGFFGEPSTWCKNTGDTLADRRTTFNDPAATSAARINDILTSTSDKSIGMQGGNTGSRAVFCTATNSDPLVTISVTLGPEGTADQWNVLRLPSSCEPGGTFPNQDRHLIVINSDDNSFAWEIYGADWLGGTSWTAYSMRRWCRNAAACTGDDGGGRGVIRPQGFDGERATTECGGSATKTIATPRKSEIAAGRITHALPFIYNRENGSNYQPLYPCYYSQQSGDGLNLNAGKMGERYMLDPDFNVDALQAGAATKVMLKALQEFGAIHMDQGCNGCRVGFLTEAEDWTGFDFSQPSGLMTTIFNNMRQIKCLSSFEGECPAGE